MEPKTVGGLRNPSNSRGRNLPHLCSYNQRRPVMNTINIQHFMTMAQLDQLAEVFAIPVEHHGNLDWMMPRWWYVAYATARS